MAKGSWAWETCKFINPSVAEICKFRNENGDNNWRLAEGNPAKCIFEGNAEQYQCGLKITADAWAAGTWTVKMEQWEHGFYEGYKPLKNSTLELEIGNEANSLVKELLPQQCTVYNILSDESRHHSNDSKTSDQKWCDADWVVHPSHKSIDWKGPGWYRVKDETHGSNRLANSSEVTAGYKCGATGPGYLKSPVHPEIG